MTKQEAIDQLNAMPVGGDEEALHAKADEILLDLLADQGMHEVAEAFDAAKKRVGFWYA